VLEHRIETDPGHGSEIEHAEETYIVPFRAASIASDDVDAWCSVTMECRASSAEGVTSEQRGRERPADR